MMKQFKKTPLLAFVFLLLIISAVRANDNTIRNRLSKIIPSLQIDSIQLSPIKGLYEVTVGADILYVSEDGKFLLQGHLIDLEAEMDLTEKKLANIRSIALEKIKEDRVISFKAKNAKHSIFVFTDIDCGYCRKLHAEIDQYLAEGITIHYLFYPRAGKGSESYNKAISVWCAKDRRAALTTAKKGENLEQKSCDNPIDEHMQLGVDFDVRGTPMLVTEKGHIYPGYIPAKQLSQTLAND